ncbi:MAG: hypothetical protein JO166_19560 [Deltaproteobacteria bacterium]|nr:hypothetical protein [Deltaproteobacteria bacterium]
MKRAYHSGLLALVGYLSVSILFVGLPVLAHPATVHVGLGADPSQMMWFMVWWPYALVHHVNPFVSHAIWVPTGANLTWTTSIPAVALALTPITWMFGPVISYNVAAVFAPALSAWSAFLLCRWLTCNYTGAVIGGLLYGFSPYEFGHILGGHLSFTINFVPPLCLLLFGQLLDRSVTGLGFVFTFAILLVIQCLISNEVLATMTAFGVLAWLIAYALFPTEQRIRLRTTIVPITTAYLLAGFILSPFFYFALANGAMPRRPLFPPSFFSADLVGFVIPTPLLLLARHSFEALISKNFGNIQENEFYLGIPALMLVSWFFWVRRSESFARLFAVMLGVIIVAAIGPVLHAADHSVSEVPWAAVFELPLLKQALPVRVANYGFLVVALIAALSLATPKRRFSEVLVAYTFASYLPNVSLFLWPEHYQNPPFFASGLYHQVLHQGENIVIFPYGATGPSMMWQAETGMYFSMSGAWMGPTPEEFQRWPIVSAALVGLPLADPGQQLRSFLIAHQVQAVIAAEGATSLPAALGIKPIELGGVSVYRLPNDSPATVPKQTIDRLEEAAGQEWIAHLLEAASRFLDGTRDLETLDPVKLKELGFLPNSRWGRTLDLVLGGASHGAIAPVWIGPGPSGTVAAGLFASPSAATALASFYRGFATSILYPYPLRFTGGTPVDNEVQFLLITMPQAIVRADARFLRGIIAPPTN